MQFGLQAAPTSLVLSGARAGTFGAWTINRDGAPPQYAREAARQLVQPQAHDNARVGVLGGRLHGGGVVHVEKIAVRAVSNIRCVPRSASYGGTLLLDMPLRKPIGCSLLHNTPARTVLMLRGGMESSGGAMDKECSRCLLVLPHSSFSKSQLRKGDARRCNPCVAAAAPSGSASASDPADTLLDSLTSSLNNLVLNPSAPLLSTSAPARQRGARAPTREQTDRWLSEIESAALGMEEGGVLAIGFRKMGEWLLDDGVEQITQTKLDALQLLLPRVLEESVEVGGGCADELVRLGYPAPTDRAMEHAAHAFVRSCDRLVYRLRWIAEHAASSAGDNAPLRARRVAGAWVAEHAIVCSVLCREAAARVLRLDAECYCESDSGESFGRPILYVVSCDDNPVRSGADSTAAVVGSLALGTRVEGWPLGAWLELVPTERTEPLDGAVDAAADSPRFVRLHTHELYGDGVRTLIHMQALCVSLSAVRHLDDRNHYWSRYVDPRVEARKARSMAAAAQGAPSLPAGWCEHKDPATGTAYYSDGVKSQWERPTAAAAATALDAVDDFGVAADFSAAAYRACDAFDEASDDQSVDGDM